MLESDVTGAPVAFGLEPRRDRRTCRRRRGEQGRLSSSGWYGAGPRLELRRRPTGADGTRLLVFGAGEGGAQVITVMLRVLDMGTPVRIAEVAERLVSQAKRPTRVEYTGLRAGEKLHEVLLAEGEADNRPIHPLISHVPVPPLDPVDARSLDPWAARQEVIQAVESLAGQPLPAGSSSLS